MRRQLLVIGVICIALCTFAGDYDVIVAEKGEPVSGGRSISGSLLTVEAVDDTDPAAVVIDLLGVNASDDYEYWDRVLVELPAGWSILSLGADDFTTLAFYEMPVMEGVGTATAVWRMSDYPCSGLGFMRGDNNQARFTITVDPVGDTGDNIAAYMLEGDGWGSDPHVVCSTTSTCAHDACFGATTPEATTDLTITIAGVAPTPTPAVQPAAIPTLSTTGMFVLIGLLVGIGILILFRRG